MIRRLPWRRRALALAAMLGAVLTAPGFGSAQGEDTRALIDSGHAGAVRGMELDDRSGLLFTAGQDGTVRIWDPSSGDLQRVLQVTQLQAGRIAVSPVAPMLAVVVSDGSGGSFLAVWDWEQERQLYRVPLREEPLFVRFSPMGTYLLYGESSWQGLKILQAASGAPVAFHPEGFGIVGFAEMSRSEKLVMTYQVSGRITYWDVATGARTMDVPTVAYLSGIRISEDRGVLVGSTATEIVRVDAVSGVVRGRAPFSGATSLDLSDSGDEISALSGPARVISRWTVTGDSLSVAAPRGRLPGSPALVAYGKDALYVADAAGGLDRIDADGSVTTFGKNVVASLTGFDVAPGLVALASRAWVRVLSVGDMAATRFPSSIHTRFSTNPLPGDTGLAFLDPGRLLAWGTGSTAPGLALLDLSAAAGPGAAFAGIASPFRAGLTALRVSADELIGVESGGTIRVADPRTGASRFDTRIAGAQAAVRVSPGELVAARNTSGSQPGSLVRLNLSTGETVPLADRNLFTYCLLLDRNSPSGPALYSIGVDSARKTNLLLHDGPGFERETVLDTVPQENLDARLSLDPDRHVLFATMGQDRAVSWDGHELKVLSLHNTVPTRLLVRSGLAFSLNKDSTVTVADAGSGERLADLALFADGEWCVVFSDGHYAASTGGDAHVRVFADGSPVSTPEDYRLRIEVR
ncbi:MAG TPA: WD40 repeat domain-containing protein [Spirochaetia bacterium]|nr:WD40 repeat domain-containing protein [Spirochaetia bacterium]